MRKYRVPLYKERASEEPGFDDYKNHEKKRKRAKSSYVPMPKLFDEKPENKKEVSPTSMKKIKRLIKSLSRMLKDLDGLENILTEDFSDFRRELKKSRKKLRKLHSKKH